MPLADHRLARLLRRAARALGPGLITGASDDDPSGIGTYAITGASQGYAMLWTAWLTYPLMAAVQVICARIGMVSGEGLGGVLRRHYPRPVVGLAVLMLAVANTLNIGADLAGIAAAVNLLVPVPSILLIPLLGLSILLFEVFGAYRVIERTFKWLTLALFAYVASAFLAHPDWNAVLRATVRPTLSWHARDVATLVAILGTTISPYLFFWQASLEVEEEVSQGRKTLDQRRGATDTELTDASIDVNVGMGYSNLVMYFIILSSAATLHVAGRTDIRSATDAAKALVPLAGPAAGLLWALGLIGAGLLAVPVLSCSLGYAVAETFEWTHGLDQRWSRAWRFYGVIAISTVLGLALDFVGINPFDALFWTAVVNGVLAPPLMILIMLVANNRRVMGDRVNGLWLNVLGWGATLLMGGAAIALFATWGA